MILTAAICVLIALLLFALAVEWAIIRDLSTPPAKWRSPPPTWRESAPARPRARKLKPIPTSRLVQDRNGRLRVSDGERLEKFMKALESTRLRGEFLLEGDLRLLLSYQGKDGLSWCRTAGLERVGRRELALTGLRELNGDLTGAMLMMHQVVGYVVEQSLYHRPDWKPGPGDILRIGLWHTEVECRCEEAVVDGRRVLRLVDPSGGEGVAREALANSLCDQGLMLLEERGPRLRAVRRKRAYLQLKNAIECFPGDPSARSFAFTEGRIRNGNNYLSYLGLAALDAGLEAEWYRQAVERCAALEAYELGSPALPELERARLMSEVALIADTNLKGPSMELAVNRQGWKYKPGGPCWVPSPIWENGPKGWVWRALSVLPSGCGRYVFGPGTQERLKDEPELQALVADVYARMRQKPLEAVLETREIRKLYLGYPSAGDVQDDPKFKYFGPSRRPLRMNYQPHYKLLSTIMAEACRYLAAGATLEELRAAFKLEADEGARMRAEQKLQTHREEFARWTLEAASVGSVDPDENEEQEEH